MNLLSNAVKFSFKGEIIVSASSRDIPSSGKVEISFIVADEGIGITEEAQRRLFQPFRYIYFVLLTHSS